MPWWWGWWRGGSPQTQSQEIAHGTTRKATDGSFKIEFAAKPDPKLPEKDEPTFVFQINADVTDSAGETRSADRAIRVGYTALEAMISADDWQSDTTPVELKLETKTLDGEPQVAEGSVKIYDLQAPETVHRPPLSGLEPWRYGGGFGGGDVDQGDAGKDLSNPNSWPLGKVVVEKGFTTDTNGVAKLPFKLAAGAYRAVLETQDRFGKKVTGKLPLQVLQPSATKLAIKIPQLLDAPDWEPQPGQEFMALWGTGYETGRAFIEIEHRHQMVQRYWTKAGQTQQQIKLAVTEAMRGGFFVHVTYVRENRAYLQTTKVSVPWKNKDLDLKWEHFVSKLQPGQKETWTIVVQSPKPKVQSAEKAVAEMVATLYDESLDAFAPLNWPHRFSVFREDYSTVQSQFANTPLGFQQVFGNWDRPYESVEITYRSFPPDLTQNLWGYRFYARKAMNVTTLSGARSEAAAPMAMAAAEMPAMAMTPPPMGAPAGMAAVDRLGVVALADQREAGESGVANKQPATPKLDLGKVAARKNLNETAV